MDVLDPVDLGPPRGRERPADSGNEASEVQRLSQVRGHCNGDGGQQAHGAPGEEAERREESPRPEPRQDGLALSECGELPAPYVSGNTSETAQPYLVAAPEEGQHLEGEKRRTVDVEEEDLHEEAGYL